MNRFLSKGYREKRIKHIRWILQNQQSFLIPYLEQMEKGSDGLLLNIPRKHRYKSMAEFEVIHENRKESYLVKIYKYPYVSQKIKQLFKHTRGFHEFFMTYLAARKGIPVEVPVAYGERKRVFVEESYLIIRKIKDSCSIREYFRDATPSGERRDVLAKFGELAKEVHDAGIRQDAFSLDNFLVYDEAGNKKIIVIDFEMVSVRTKGIGERLRMWYLSKLNREKRYFSNTDRIRFLLSYTGGDFPSCKKLARQIEALTTYIQKKDAKKLSRSCTRENRRFGIFRNEKYSGYYNKEYSPETLTMVLNAIEETPRDVFFLDQFRIVRYTGLNYHTITRVWSNANALCALKIDLLVPVGIVKKYPSERQQDEGFFISRLPDNCLPLSQYPGLSSGKNLSCALVRFAERVSPFGAFNKDLSHQDIFVQERGNSRLVCYLGNYASFRVNRFSIQKNWQTNISIIKQLLPNPNEPEENSH